MTTTIADPTRPDTHTPTPATIAKGAGIGIGLALVTNVIVFAIGNAGAPLQVIMNGDTKPTDLAIAAVIAASIAPVIVGAVGLWVLQRFLDNGFRIWAIAALGLAAASVAAPLGLDISTDSKVALTLMHLAVGVSAVVGQAIVRRSEAPIQ